MSIKVEKVHRELIHKIQIQPGLNFRNLTHSQILEEALLYLLDGIQHRQLRDAHHRDGSPSLAFLTFRSAVSRGPPGRQQPPCLSACPSFLRRSPRRPPVYVHFQLSFLKMERASFSSQRLFM